MIRGFKQHLFYSKLIPISQQLSLCGFLALVTILYFKMYFSSVKFNLLILDVQPTFRSFTSMINDIVYILEC